MLTLHSHQAFDLAIYTLKKWNLPVHKHRFFELVYVLEGSGIHIVNNNGYAYEPGSLYLLTPYDRHSFEIQKESTFCIIIINEIYFSGHHGDDQKIDLSAPFHQLEYIFLNHNNISGEPIKNSGDRLWVNMLMKRMMEEVDSKAIYHEVIVQNLVFLLLNQIARAIQESNRLNFSVKHPSDISYDIISYIQQHIYEKDKLRIESIADAFFKSKHYITQYFREQTGETIKEYVLSYKMNLVKSRLVNSDLTISQIAAEVGFTDESHLNKTFKMREGITAREYKLKNR